jgi:hypothetical protein
VVKFEWVEWRPLVEGQVLVQVLMVVVVVQGLEGMMMVMINHSPLGAEVQN